MSEFLSSGNPDSEEPARYRGYRLLRNLNRRDCPPGSSLVSVENDADEISATGGRQCHSHSSLRTRHPVIKCTLSAEFEETIHLLHDFQCVFETFVAIL